MRKINLKLIRGLGALLVAVGLVNVLIYFYPGKESGPPDVFPPVFSTDLNSRFAVIGDFGLAGEHEADVADLVKSWQPDFIVTTGDNNYSGGSELTIEKNIGQYYSDYIVPCFNCDPGEYPTQNRFFPVPGNHDWKSIVCVGDYCRGPYLEYFSLPGDKLYYDFIWGSVHFFMLDSNPQEPDGISPDSVQGQWLKERLAASTSDWNVVIAHHPPYSSGKHGSNEFMQWPFQEWGADIVMSGHDHTYERIEVVGFPYIVNGLGGKSRYTFGAAVSGSQIRYNQDFGAMLIEATPQALVLEFITRTGETIDHFELDH